MIGRHVDLIAVGLLLSAIALYYGARHAMFLAVVPYKRITIIEPVRPPSVVLPQVPRVPFTRD
jgi:hypothetical protein